MKRPASSRLPRIGYFPIFAAPPGAASPSFPVAQQAGHHEPQTATELERVRLSEGRGSLLGPAGWVRETAVGLKYTLQSRGRPRRDKAADEARKGTGLFED